jgi:multicomponent Na+:H+ antiporter subunit E
MTVASTISVSALARSAAGRALGFFIVWVILSGDGSVDMAPGIVAVLGATAVSLWALPPVKGNVQPLAMAEFGLRFLGQSVLAGADVARRALDPRLPVNPGFVRYATGFPPGPARNLFTTLTSLLPGTVPVGADESGALVIHCLDIGQPVTTQLAAEEALLVRVIGRTHGDA